MEAKIQEVTVVNVHLIMSKEEAEWLKNLVYTVPARVVPGDATINAEMTQKFYNTLKSLV